MLLRRKFSPGLSRAVNHLLRSLRGIRHATATAANPDAATAMEKLDAALNNMSHGLCMFGPDNRLLLWNDRYARPPARRMHTRRNDRGAQGGGHGLSRPQAVRIETADGCDDAQPRQPRRPPRRRPHRQRFVPADAKRLLGFDPRGHHRTRRTRQGSRIWHFTTCSPACRTGQRSTSGSQTSSGRRPATPRLLKQTGL